MFCSVWNTHGFTAFKSGMPFETVKSRVWSWPMQYQGEALRLVLANVSRSASEPGLLAQGNLLTAEGRPGGSRQEVWFGSRISLLLGGLAGPGPAVSLLQSVSALTLRARQQRHTWGPLTRVD